MPGISANTEAALIKDALELNAAVCAPPLPQCQVLAMARCVWKYKERGTLWADDGGARVLLDIWEFDSLADEPEAIALLILLKLAHGAREADFAIVPESMATAGLLEDWGKKSYMRTRDILLERGFIERTHEGGGRGNPHRYRLLTSVKGAPRDHNIKETNQSLRARTGAQARLNERVHPEHSDELKRSAWGFLPWGGVVTGLRDGAVAMTVAVSGAVVALGRRVPGGTERFSPLRMLAAVRPGAQRQSPETGPEKGSRSDGEREGSGSPVSWRPRSDRRQALGQPQVAGRAVGTAAG